MYLKLAHILSWIFFLVASFCSARIRQYCDPGSQCKFLSTCPQMVDLINSGNSANIQTVRNNICGFVGSKSKVCCPTTLISSTTQPSSSTFTFGHLTQSESLLPTKCGRPASDDKIVNGKPAPIGAYPWVAAFGYTLPGNSKLSFACAGTIINEKYVLTAAHCIDPKRLFGRKLSVIHLGDYNLATKRDCERTLLGERCSNPHIVVGVEDTVIHPMYNKRGSSSDDIALVRLDTTLNFDSNSVTIEPVCIPPNGFNFKSFAGGRQPVAVGWGWTEHGNSSDILLRVSLPIADDNLCKSLYQGNFVGNQLCIGGTKEDTCGGDSGGPLVMTGENGPPFFQVGIVSFGPKDCGQINFPAVYINVADYRNWIIDNMRP